MISNEIIDDLEARELIVHTLICVTEEGKFQVISYKNNLVNYISAPINNVSINERLGGNMVQPLVDLKTK